MTWLWILLGLAALTLIGAAVCLLIFVFSKAKGGFGTEFGKLNWTAIVLGIVILLLSMLGNSGAFVEEMLSDMNW